MEEFHIHWLAGRCIVVPASCMPLGMYSAAAVRPLHLQPRHGQALRGQFAGAT
jgi:hypothetical protein